MNCKICGAPGQDGKRTVSGIGPVCYSCYMKPHKQSHRAECVKKFGKHKKIDFKDHNLRDFIDAS